MYFSLLIHIDDDYISVAAGKQGAFLRIYAEHFRRLSRHVGYQFFQRQSALCHSLVQDGGQMSFFRRITGNCVPHAAVRSLFLTRYGSVVRAYGVYNSVFKSFPECVHVFLFSEWRFHLEFVSALFVLFGQGEIHAGGLHVYIFVAYPQRSETAYCIFRRYMDKIYGHFCFLGKI